MKNKQNEPNFLMCIFAPLIMGLFAKVFGIDFLIGSSQEFFGGIGIVIVVYFLYPQLRAQELLFENRYNIMCEFNSFLRDVKDVKYNSSYVYSWGIHSMSDNGVFVSNKLSELLINMIKYKMYDHADQVRDMRSLIYCWQQLYKDQDYLKKNPE